MSVPLRIAIPIHSFEPGGVERVALNLAAAWQADGAEVKVLLGRSASGMDTKTAQMAINLALPRLAELC